ncbi:hypothetical protein ACUOCP_40525, partial [Escherichia sp. R-CC3]
MPNITWCDLPEDVSLWPGLPLSLSGDEVMPLDYHAGRRTQFALVLGQTLFIQPTTIQQPAA